MICEEKPCLMHSSSGSGFVLPTNYVSVPNNEEGYITLRQQSVKSKMSEGQESTETKKWHHKAIRRNLSKSKDLVLFVGGLKCNLPPSRYTTYATKCAKVENKSSFGPVFSNLGCFFITFLSGTSCSQALKLFRVTRFCGQIPELTLLPYISMPAQTEERYDPLLVFINCKSGGGQGCQLSAMMSQILNPCQLFMMDKGGAVPGLYAFRKLPLFRILVCGGDGTVGWVLSHLEEVQSHLVCQNPPIAVLPLGTGNDLARVLGNGSGWEGGGVTGILARVQDLQPTRLDRWNVIFDSTMKNKTDLSDPLLLSDAVTFQKDFDLPDPFVSPVDAATSTVPVGLTLESPVLEHTTGVRNLGTMTLPPVVECSDPSVAVEFKIQEDVTITHSNDVCDAKTADGSVLPGVEEQNDGIVKSAVSNESTPETSAQTSSNLTDDTVSVDEGADTCSDTIQRNAFFRSGCMRFYSEGNNRLARQNRLKNNSRHRLVHILSESDLFEFGQSHGLDGEDIDADAQWRDKIKSLRLSDYAEKDDKSETSSMSSELEDVDGLEMEALADEGNEPHDDIFEETASPGHVDTEYIEPLRERHHSVATDSAVSSDSKRPYSKKYSLPVIPSFSSTQASISEPTDDVKKLVMSNYFGIGIDAELTLAFHLAREENPEKCTSRFRNKAIYFKAGLKKMTSRSVNLNNVIDLEVDNVPVALPSIRGLIFLNISSWGSGSNAWGSGGSKKFHPPSFGDGLLEVIGVGGVAHMSQMYSGLRAGIRIAQGKSFTMHLKAEVAMQIDGEPWMQLPGKITISRFSHQVTMLRRVKKKTK